MDISSGPGGSYLDGGEETGTGEASGGARQLLGSVEESFIVSPSNRSVVAEDGAVVEALQGLGRGSSQRGREGEDAERSHVGPMTNERNKQTNKKGQGRKWL